MKLSAFATITILLLIAFSASLLFKRLKLPTILGYLLVGTLVGPRVTGLISNNDNILIIAEFGIVFLMFTIGLEFSLPKLIAMRKTVFGYGGLQVILSILITFLIAKLLGINNEAAFIIGTVVAMSSTAIVVKQLLDQAELYLPSGHNAVGILLLQDLAVIPCLILIPSLASVNHESFIVPLLWALMKSVGVVGIIILLGKLLLRPLLRKIAHFQSSELFTLFTLLVAVSSAWLTSLLGLSLTLGAFFAGILLAETEFQHQINVEIRPFRDLLLGIFFISIGMQFSLSMLISHWYWIILLLLALILFKILLIFGLGLLLKHRKMPALRTALILAQGGEFGFAILFSGLDHQLITQDYGQVIFCAILISLLISPFIIRYNAAIARWFIPKHKKNSHDQVEKAAKAAKDFAHHTIICGYGRVGQNIASLLKKEQLKFLALDTNIAHVQAGRLDGDNIIYGNASHGEILKAAGINDAKALVICIDKKSIILKILNQARNLNQIIPILVRSHDDQDIELYQNQGATEVIPETLESSLTLGSHVLLYMGIPAIKVFNEIELTRRSRYQLFRSVFPADQAHYYSEEHLYAVLLSDCAAAIGTSVKQFNQQLNKAKIVAIQHNGVYDAAFPADYIFKNQDVVVLFGHSKDIHEAEKCLLKGE